MSCSNVTNRQDPASLRSRIFVGNLNTVKMPRSEVERIFSKYGPILGVSLHKGYGFVQFSNEYNARTAAETEDNNVYYGMALDVTIASEPKNRKRVRSNVVGAGCSPQSSNMSSMDIEALVNVGGKFSQMSLPSSQYPQVPILTTPIAQYGIQAPIIVPQQHYAMMPLQQQANFSNASLLPSTNLIHSTSANTQSSAPKRTRLEPNTNLHTQPFRNQKKKSVIERRSGSKTTVTADDILICGKCKRCFDDVEDLMTHKMAGCNLNKGGVCKAPGEPVSLDCATCEKNYSTSWELINHCQTVHNLKIYSPPKNSCFTDLENVPEVSESEEEVSETDFPIGITVKLGDDEDDDDDNDEDEENKKDEENSLLKKDLENSEERDVKPSIVIECENEERKSEELKIHNNNNNNKRKKRAVPNRAVKKPTENFIENKSYSELDSPVISPNTQRSQAKKRDNTSTSLLSIAGKRILQQTRGAARRPKSAPRLGANQRNNEEFL